MYKTLSYKTRINKTTDQKANEWLELCRQLYNAALEQRRYLWTQRKQSISCYDQTYQLPNLKKELPEFKQVGAQIQQDVLARLDKAYQAFFRKVKQGQKVGLPRFKSAGRYNSFTLSQCGWRFQGRKLIIRNLGTFKLYGYLYNLPQGKIKTITIRKDSLGDWHVFIVCDISGISKTITKPSKQEVGIDLGLTSFIATSDGQIIKAPKPLKRKLNQLVTLSRDLSSKQRGSNNYKRSCRKLASLHKKISNTRKDFLHKESRKLINTYAFICMEDLNVSNMLKNPLHARNISDVGWSIFLNLMFYKAEEAGRTLVLVNPKHTSKRCSTCSSMVPKTLYERIHQCPCCGVVLDRDVNAAVNILGAGHAQVLMHSLRGLLGQSKPSTV